MIPVSIFFLIGVVLYIVTVANSWAYLFTLGGCFFLSHYAATHIHPDRSFRNFIVQPQIFFLKIMILCFGIFFIFLLDFGERIHLEFTFDKIRYCFLIICIAIPFQIHLTFDKKENLDIILQETCSSCHYVNKNNKRYKNKSAFLLVRFIHFILMIIVVVDTCHKTNTEGLDTFLSYFLTLLATGLLCSINLYLGYASCYWGYTIGDHCSKK
jgi:hypothetical protein